MKKNNLLFKVSIFVIIFAIILISIIFLSNTTKDNTEKRDSKIYGDEYKYQIGSPGPGQKAPEFTLPSTDGKMVSLSSYKGENVLLYFQEGIMCQACWTQLKDIENSFEQLQNLGIDEILTITTDPLDSLKQKVDIEKLTTPVLSDEDVSVSKEYTTNLYGMMNKNYNGHTFILVGDDGTIKWRADYGGEPDFIMYLPISALISDIESGLKKGEVTSNESN
ncbi:peroxiredoxin family protein [Radiobacillus sp. PE A8.2]|uniref:peroxiredoxin family protein n=1 Tax=Radiobacillus sp. PE A8.2 TaxID=3380349 RepID=UPI0038907633